MKSFLKYDKILPINLINVMVADACISSHDIGYVEPN